MLIVVTTDSAGEIENMISERYGNGAALADARIAAQAASRHGYTGRAVVLNELGQRCAHVRARGPILREAVIGF